MSELRQSRLESAAPKDAHFLVDCAVTIASDDGSGKLYFSAGTAGPTFFSPINKIKWTFWSCTITNL